MSEPAPKTVCWLCAESPGGMDPECPKCRDKAKARAVEIDGCEKLAAWMIDNGFATGHGDTMEHLLKELTWQVAELRRKLAEAVKAAT